MPEQRKPSDSSPTGLSIAVKRAGFTQRGIAGLVRRSPATVSRWCAGLSVPDDESLTLLSTVLGIERDILTAPARLKGES